MLIFLGVDSRSGLRKQTSLSDSILYGVKKEFFVLYTVNRLILIF